MRFLCEVRTAKFEDQRRNFARTVGSVARRMPGCQAARRRRRANAGLVFWVQALRRATLA